MHEILWRRFFPPGGTWKSYMIRIQEWNVNWLQRVLNESKVLLGFWGLTKAKKQSQVCSYHIMWATTCSTFHLFIIYMASPPLNYKTQIIRALPLVKRTFMPCSCHASGYYITVWLIMSSSLFFVFVCHFFLFISSVSHILNMYLWMNNNVQRKNPVLPAWLTPGKSAHVHIIVH